MQSSTTLEHQVVHAPDLQALASAPGPVLTVYLETDPSADNAAHHSQQRWRALRQALAHHGADDAALAAVDPLVAEGHRHGACLAVVAGADGVRHTEHGPLAPQQSAGWWAPLPRLAPILEWRQTAVPHVVVLADRRGADIFATGYGGPELHLAAGGRDGP